jgi:hypothetical protein
MLDPSRCEPPQVVPALDPADSLERSLSTLRGSSRTKSGEINLRQRGLKEDREAWQDTVRTSLAALRSPPHNPIRA